VAQARQWGIRLQVAGLLAMVAGILWRITRHERPLFEDLMGQVFTLQFIAWIGLAAIPYLVGYVITLIHFLRARPSTRPVEHALLVAPWGVGAMLLLLAVLSGCRQQSVAQAPPTDKEWTLVSIEQQPLDSATIQRLPTLELVSAESRASGFAGCNRFAGSYTLSSGSLEFGPLALTRMACPSGMDLENRFAAVLGRVRSYRMNGERLVLVSGDTVLAELR
jgi:heat shock protein HslJ